MKHFKAIEKLDTAILYILELASNLSIILLAFGLIASMAGLYDLSARELHSLLQDNLNTHRATALY